MSREFIVGPHSDDSVAALCQYLQNRELTIVSRQPEFPTKHNPTSLPSRNPGACGFIFGDKFPWVWDMNVLRLAGGAGAYPFDWA